MKKQLLIGAWLLTLGLGLSASPISPEEALRRLPQSTRAKVAGMNTPQLVHTANTINGQPAVYVFNKPNNKGYMLLSADDMAYPLLGYADNGSFDSDNIPPAMQWWLEEYSRQIEYAEAHIYDISSFDAQALSARSAASRATRESIAPMIKTDWDQGEPYNDMCPTDATVHTYTGCVATAMAQVMNYWKYPQRATGKISYTMSSLAKKVELNFDTEGEDFDWDNMLDVYYPGRYNNDQAHAVAYLMMACGYAVKMDYGTDSSGALAMDIRQGMVKYFNYDGNSTYDLRMMHSSDEWADMIYDNLKNVGPILYGGASYIGGGHSFICDGYEDGLFHFNWGWTGMSNGYFSLEALNPSSLGAGGGAGGGYNFTQDAIFGLQPPTGKPVVPQIDQLTEVGSLVADIANDSIRLDLEMQSGAMWVNYNPTTMYVNIGAKIEPQGSTAGETLYHKITARPIRIQGGYGTGPSNIKAGVPLNKYNLADGTYKVSIVTLDYQDSNADWIPVKNPYSYYDYVVLRKSGDNYTVENLMPASLDIVDGGVDGDLYYGCVSRFWLDVENNFDIEVSSGLAPYLVGSAGAFLGESVLVSIPPHTKKRVEWTTELYALQNMSSMTQPLSLIMTVMDENSFLVYSNDIQKQVTMYPNPGAPTVTLARAATIANASREIKMENGGLTTIYTIDDPTNIEISARLRMTSGYFAYPVVACLCHDSDTQEGMVEIDTYAGNTVFMDVNELTDFETEISYPAFEAGREYTIIMGYTYGGSNGGIVPILGGNTVKVKLSQSGVEEIAADADDINIIYDSATATVKATSPAGITAVNAYNVDGSLIGNGESELSLENAAKGIVIVSARDSRGNVKTAKIAR